MNTDLNRGKRGLQFFICCSGFFYDLLDESSFRSSSNFGRPATPGKVHHCYNFSPFVDNGLTMVHWSPKTFKKGFIISFQTDTCQQFCLSSVLKFI